MKTLVYLLSVLFVTTTVFGAAGVGTYGGGSGTAQDPYLISQPAHLLELAGHMFDADRTLFYKMTSDIDMSSIAPGSYTPIGFANWGFAGTFDGDDHVISNLHHVVTTATSYVGLFGYVANGTIKNLGVVNFSMSGPANDVGAIAGYMYYGLIDNCWCISNVTVSPSNLNVGGLIGTLYYGTVSNCRSSGSITCGASAFQIGGLLGHLEYGSVTNCSSSVSITGPSTCYSVGGLVGRQERDTISYCFTASSIKAGYNVGGIVGYATSPAQPADNITYCCSASDVSVTSSGHHCGGLVGYSQNNKISNCIASGTVTGDEQSHHLGGLCGWQLFGSVTNSSSTAAVSGGLKSEYLGGFAGSLLGPTITKCFSEGPVVSAGAPMGYSSQMIGGFAGHFESGTISDCYATSSVTGGPQSTKVAGFIAYLGNGNGTISNCFAAGPVSGTYETAGFASYKVSKITINTSFWDIDTTGQLTSYTGAGKGKTNAEMLLQSTFSGAGWDFASTWEMNGYPALAWQSAIAVSGDLSLDLTPNQSGQISFQLFSAKNETINWTITDFGDSSFVTSVSPVTGTSTGPSDKTTVTVNVNPGQAPLADYATMLTISADNGDMLYVPVKIHVFDRVDLVKFSTLASYWSTTACLAGQPCKNVDFYVDGTINTADLALFAQGWLTDHVDKVLATAQDGFETGDFSSLSWVHSGNAPWTIIPTGAFDGSFCAKSGTIDNSQTSSLELTLDTTGWEIDAISFVAKVSSEGGYDYFRFYIDAVEQTPALTGEIIWTQKTFAITPGLHTFKWTYQKDSDGSAGSDCVWLDSVRIFKQ